MGHSVTHYPSQLDVFYASFCLLLFGCVLFWVGRLQGWRGGEEEMRGTRVKTK